MLAGIGNLSLKLSFVILIFLFPFPLVASKIANLENFVIQKIEFSGNQKTKDLILKRELQFHENDTLSAKDFLNSIVKSRENLMNTALFNFVTINYTVVPDSLDSIALLTLKPVALHVILSERWYTWPFPIIQIKERNFNAWLKGRSIADITYGVFLQQNNFRGRREKLVFSFLYGFDQKLGVTFEKPYLNKQQTIGFVSSLSYTRNHTVSYASYSNKVQSVRFLNDFIISSLLFSNRFIYRKDYHVYHAIAINYSRLRFSDTLFRLNPDFNFKQRKQPDYFSLIYRLKLDFRDYQPYPLKGWYFDLELEKTGIDFQGGQEPDLMTLKSSFRKYVELGHRTFFASGIHTKVGLNAYTPYYFQKGLGYENDYVRGYEYYVVDGQDFVLIKNNLKYTILPTQERFLPGIHNEKFSRIHYTLHANLFFDVAYVNDQTLSNANRLANNWISGFGVGFDFVTYYDRVFRVEFSGNNQGEKGIFLNFVSPI